MLITPIEVFGQELEPEVYNLLHVHLPTSRTTATIDIVSIPDEDDIHKHFVFKKDITGQELNYKILVQKNRVKTILYNSKGKVRELKFTQQRFAVGDYVDINNLRLPGIHCGRIESIPIQTLASVNKQKIEQYERSGPLYEMASCCKTRYFEELMGFIDIETIPDLPERPPEIVKISVPVCECYKGKHAEDEANRIFLKWKQAKINKILTMLEEHKKLEDIFNAKCKEMTLKEKKSILERFQSMEAELTHLPEEDSINASIIVCINMLRFL